MGDTLATLCLSAGIIAICIGLILTGKCLTCALSRYIYLPTHSPMPTRKCYLSISDYKISLEAININKVSVLNSLQPVTSSNNALSLLYSCVHAIALLQAGCYEGDNFVPEAPVVRLTALKQLISKRYASRVFPSNSFNSFFCQHTGRQGDL